MYQLHLCYTVISSPLKIKCQDISKPVSIPVSVAYSTLSSNFLYTLQYPAVPCSTHLQYPQYPVPCSTHSTHSTLQYPRVLPQYPTVTLAGAVPAVPTVPCSTHGYCAVPRFIHSTRSTLPLGSTHSTRTAAVPTGTVQYPPG